MFDLDTIKHSLQVPSDKLDWLIKTLLPSTHKNYQWARANRNISGLTDLRTRVGQFDCPWQPVSMFNIPDLEQPFNKTLAEIYDQRALDIFAHARTTGKQIVIMWSGGIDSTSLVCAFIKNLSTADLGMIKICCSTQSLAENPYFYQTQIRGKFELWHWREVNVCNEFFKKYILLTGDPGDCIFGPSTNKYKMLWNNDLYLRPWKDSRSLLYQIYHDPTDVEFAQWYVDMVSNNLWEQQQQGLYTRVKTISDWHWWHYYNFKWQGSMTRPLSKNKKNSKSKIDAELTQEFFDLCFYGSDDFQIWSYQNLHNLCGDQMQNHKQESKKYIYELDGNKHYQRTKRKEAVGPDSWVKPLLVDKDCVHWHASDPGVIDTWKTVLTP